jgi:hypothetical protein
MPFDSKGWVKFTPYDTEIETSANRAWMCFKIHKSFSQYRSSLLALEYFQCSGQKEKLLPLFLQAQNSKLPIFIDEVSKG